MVQQDLIILFRWSQGARFFLLGEREVALEMERYPLLHHDHNEPCRRLCCAWLVGGTPLIGWLLLVVYWCLLYHLESRWRNSHVLVYHGPLLIHLWGVASHLLSIRCTFCGELLVCYGFFDFFGALCLFVGDWVWCLVFVTLEAFFAWLFCCTTLPYIPIQVTTNRMPNKESALLSNTFISQSIEQWSKPLWHSIILVG